MFLQPYQWISADLDEEEACIKVWCHVKDSSQQALVRIHNFLPRLTIEFPRKYANKDYVHAWYQSFQKYMEEKGNAPCHFRVFVAKTLYYYTSKPNGVFIELMFRTEEAKRHAANYLNKWPRHVFVNGQRDTIHVKVHEKDIETWLKYLTAHKQQLCQWIKVPMEALVPPEKRVSVLDLEFKINGGMVLESIPLDATQDWISYPIVASFDIETYSNNHKQFPNSTYALHECYMMSVIIKVLNKPEPPKRILICTKCCDDIKDSEVYVVESEVDLIHKFSDIISEYSPTILTGYNIFRYDIVYMNNRLKIFHEEWKNLSLLKEHKTTMKVIEWQSSAYNNVHIDHLTCEGRYMIDMYNIIRREYTKLSDYKLDTVAKYFLDGQGKNPVTPIQMFQIYEMDDAKEMAIVGDYCLVDAVICIDLMEKLNIWTYLMETANIVDVNIDALYMRGQQVRVNAQLYRNCNPVGIIINTRNINSKGVKGGYVIPPLPGLSNNSIILDFASLYPSTIIAHNICYTTLLDPTERNDETRKLCNVFEWTEEETKHEHWFIKSEIQQGLLPHICKNLLSERAKVRKNIKPENSEMVNTILDTKQKALKVCANSVYGFLAAVKTGKLSLYEGAEVITSQGRNLIRISTSYVKEKYDGYIIYGDTDSIMFNFPLADPVKRKRICEQMDLSQDVENLSLLSIQIGKKLADEISGLFPAPLKLEFEGVARTILNLTKKRYAKIMLDSSGKDKTLELKGVSCVRRDNCQWFRDMYRDTIEAIMNRCSLQEAQAIVSRYVNKLLREEVLDEELIITAEMNTYATDSKYPTKLFSENMKRLGFPVESGERFKFVLIENVDTKKGDKMVLYDEVFVPKRDEYNIDKKWYINQGAANNINKLLFYSFYKSHPEEFGLPKCLCGHEVDDSLVFGPCGHVGVCSFHNNPVGFYCPCGKKIMRMVNDTHIETKLEYRAKKYIYLAYQDS